MRALLLAVAVLLAAALTGCSDDAALDVHDVAPAEPPPRAARLAEADWPATAAWIRREVDAGRPVVVNLFASWCGPCAEEAPVLRAAAAAYDDVAFLGIDVRDLREAGEGFLAEHPLGFATLWDFPGAVAPELGAVGMPTTAFFDREGRLVEVFTGTLTEETLEARLADLRG